MKDMFDKLMNKCADGNIEKSDNIQHISKQEVNKLMTRFKSENNSKSKRVNIRKIVGGLTAVAACLAVVAAVPIISGNNKISDSTGSYSVSKNSFFISASAEETSETNENVVLTRDRDSGGFYIHGDNIKNVSLSIDKGELYKIDCAKRDTMLPGDKPAYSDEECREYIGSNYTGEYDDNFAYDLYISDEVFEMHEKENGVENVRKNYHDCYDDFDGAVLKITVEYNDGTTEEVSYTLKSGKLELDKETMEFTGKFTDGENTPYIYGVCFEKNQ